MNLLLDTHALLWFFSGDSNISSYARAVIEDESNNCYVSVVSLWEIVVKQSIGKLESSSSIETLVSKLNENRIAQLAI